MENIQSEIHLNQEKDSVNYKMIIGEKQYLKFIISNLVNRFGDSIDSVAFSWMIYIITGSASWSAIIFGINRIPTVFLQPIAGAIVEKLSKKRVIIIMDIVRGLCVFLVVALNLLDLLTPYLLIGITIIISSVEAFRNPASTAFLPQILKPRFYEHGMSLNTSLSTITELAGLGLSGVIIAVGGVQAAIIIDALTFFLSAGIIAMIHAIEQESTKQMSIKDSIKTFQEGLAYVKGNRILISFLIITFVANGMLVPMNSLQAPLVTEVYGQGEMMLSVIGITVSIGMAGGSFLYPFLASKLPGKLLMILGGISVGFYTIGLIITETLKHDVFLLYFVVALISVVAGMGISTMVSVLNIGFVKSVDTHYMARAGAILNAIAVAAIPILSGLLSIFVKITSIQIIFIITGLLSIGIFLAFHFNKKLIL